VTAVLEVNNRVNKTLGITVKLRITSEANSFIRQILEFLPSDGSSFVNELNIFSLEAEGQNRS
jgi:hypothetical protein